MEWGYSCLLSFRKRKSSLFSSSCYTAPSLCFKVDIFRFNRLSKTTILFYLKPKQWLKNTFSLLLLFSLSHFINAQIAVEGWEPIELPLKIDDKRFNTNYMAINDNGTILVTGYAFRGLPPTGSPFVRRPFKVFRSRDSGASWKLISDENMEKNYAFTDYTPIENNEFYQTKLSSVGNNFYLDGSTNGYYMTTDEGDNWTFVEDTNSENEYRGTTFVAPDSRITTGYYSTTAFHFVLDFIKKSSSDWVARLSPGMTTKPEYQPYYQQAPLLFFRGNNLRVFDIEKGKRIGPHEYPHYSWSLSDDGNTNDVEHLFSLEGKTLRSHQFTLPQPVYMAPKDDQYWYTRIKYGYDNRLMRSNDFGQTLRLVTIPGIREISTILPICDNGTILVGGVTADSPIGYQGRQEVKLLRSRDRGHNWEELPPAPSGGRSINPMPDGSLLALTSHGLYKTTPENGCATIEAEPEIPKDFGLTVITAESLPFSPVADQYETPAERLASAVLERAGTGRILQYTPEDGKCRVIQRLGEQAEFGEQILIFDWSGKTAWIDNDAFAYSAGEELYLALCHLNRDLFQPQKIHFIGFEKGCYVNTIAAQEIVTREPADSYSIDQMTMLYPVDYTDDYQQFRTFDEVAHTDVYISGREPVISNSAIFRVILTELLQVAAGLVDKEIQAVVGSELAQPLGNLHSSLDRLIDEVNPGLMSGSDLYQVTNELENIFSTVPSASMQQLSKRFKQFRFGLIGLKLYDYQNTFYATGIEPSNTVVWGGLDAYEILDKYIATINQADYTGNGYVHSRIGQGQALRFTNTSDLYGSSPKPFNIDSFGVFNGHFDYIHSGFGADVAVGVPGWDILKGDYTDEGRHFQLEDGGLILHERLLIPEGTQQLSFLIETKNLRSGSVAIDFYQGATNIVKTKVFPIEADIVRLVERQVDVSDLAGQVVHFSVFFDGEAYDADVAGPRLIIDNVKLGPQLSSVSQVVGASSQNITLASEETAPQSIEVASSFNGTFSSLDGWTANGGAIENQGDLVLLKPLVKKQLAVLEHAPFSVPEDAYTLSFQLGTSSISKGDITIVIEDVDSGDTEILYTEERRVSALDRIADETGRLNQSLETLGFDHYRRTLESHQADISAWRGEMVRLSIRYQPLGGGKPKLVIDDFILE